MKPTAAVPDVVVVGGGIIGTAAAALLAEQGRTVALFERQAIGSGASGRNSGVIQHPFDVELARLHHETVDLYRRFDPAEFTLPPTTSGLILLTTDARQAAESAATIADQAAELRPQILDRAELRSLEPMLADDLIGCRIETGYPVAPVAAVQAYASRARRAGARLEVGDGVRKLLFDRQRAVGVELQSGRRIECAQVLVAAGPWTSALLPQWPASTRRIRANWGVVVSVALDQRPHHVLEEMGIDRPEGPSEALFSLVTAGSETSVGSTFLELEPRAEQLVTGIIERAARYLPAVGHSPRLGLRSCARPLSFDGRPFIGPLPGHDNVFVCAGHGPWGISTGPASARLVVAQMAGTAAIDEAFAPGRGAPR